MNIALEIRHFRNTLRFIDDGIPASCGNHASLMMRNCTESAGAETAAVADNGKLYLFNRRNICIARMIGALVGQRIGEIHFLLRQRQRRLILYDIPAVIWLHQHTGCDGINVFMLYVKALCIRMLICTHRFIGGQQHIIAQVFQSFGFPAGSPDIAEILCPQSAV